ncbi:MAG: GTPase ObgE, partial [Myxococcota bacterium]|nr:GTPase ObgE [Myxococcota bacterium]
MKFLDEVIIDVRSGKGGDGMVHFHRERFVPRGGPDGGDGGRGGDVILAVDEGCNTLLHLRFNPHHRAGNGQPGGTGNRNGRGGEDVVIRLPQGTTVREVDGEGMLADLTAVGQRVVIAAGGKGGRGNAAFKSPTNRTPTQAGVGQPGLQLRLALELRLLADVGLVGLPNAGKSTLLSRLSAARPRIADYPFTTLEPSLGVVQTDDFGSFVMADLPGLVEGAHEGRGLGHRFLRHVERTAVFLYLVSLETAGDEGDDPVERFRSVYDELRAYESSLVERPGM